MPQIKKAGRNLIVQDYTEYVSPFRFKKQRALLSYLTQPVIDSLEGKKIIRFSNSGLVLCWAQVLNQLGYVVDVIDWDNKDFKPQQEYDLVIWHGGKNFSQLSSSLRGSPRYIHFLTGSYWRFNNRAEDARIKNFDKRHGFKPNRDRYIYASEDAVNEASDGIIVLGDISMRDTYPEKYAKVLTINNASYPDIHFNKIHKDYAKAKKNFMFFAGSGNIHKGLDLLLDAFSELDENLYIVTVLDNEVLKTFKSELKRPNIHLIGQVEMRERKFYDLMEKCAFVVLPSCSEGQAGSVIEAMNQGLIPIVSKETRLDAAGYGVILRDNSIGCIRRTVQRMSQLPDTEVKRLTKLTKRAVAREHTPKYFRNHLKKAIKEILDS